MTKDVTVKALYLTVNLNYLKALQFLQIKKEIYSIHFLIC